MYGTRFLVSLILVVSLLAGQISSVFAAPASQSSSTLTGTVQSITLETDPNTGITIVSLEVKQADQTLQTVRLNQNTALAIGLVMLNEDGKPMINRQALGRSVEIDPATVIPDKPQDRHPVGNALETFFTDIPGVDYETIMTARKKGAGFGVIAQALWLTRELQGNAGVFEDLLAARRTGDYTAFTLPDGTVPKNWGQLRTAVLDGRKPKVGDNSLSDQNQGNDPDKDKNKNKEKQKDRKQKKDKNK